jgi:hypothetical protein
LGRQADQNPIPILVRFIAVVIGAAIAPLP